jgi:alcohol dehydrogenase
MEDYWGVGKAKKAMLPSIGIPTTAGTGSEGQSFALISQEKTHRKMACGDKKARFRTVILDPTLLLSVPRDVATVTGMDAISHALESYVTTKRNPISQLFAKESWRLLEKHFEIVLNEPDNISAWGQMLLGAHFAGLAIENSMLGAAHAAANPLTANYGITHGVAVGLMLPHVIRYNSEAVNGLYRSLSALVNGAGEGDVGKLVERIITLKKAANLPDKISYFGIKKADLPRLAKEAAEQWTGQFNPRPVNEAELLVLYQNAF